MKYTELIKKLNIEYLEKNKIAKKDLFNLYKRTYNNDNIKTYENMVALLKKYEIISDLPNNDYLILSKPLYKIKESQEIINLYKLIFQKYNNIKFVVWDTSILNEFTHHYIMNNYIIVEVERIAIDLITTFLKENLIKKYTIVTESMYNKNKNLFLNNEHILIIKPLLANSPLQKNNETRFETTIEKIMVDIYRDRLYEQYQGKELERIYENILKKYDVNLKKIYTYANRRGNLKEFKIFINNLSIEEKYKEI